MSIKKILFLLVFSCNLYFPQSGEKTKEIDSLIDLADQNIYVDFDKTLLFAEKALTKAKKDDDSERIAKACFYVARSYIFTRSFEASPRYLEEGIKITATTNNIILKSLYLNLQGIYYSSMSMFEQSLESYQNALKLIEQNNDLESQLLVAILYTRFADHYTDKGDFKSAHLYADKSIDAIEKIPKEKYLSAKKIYREKPLIYFYKSWILLQEKKPDQALPFIQRAYNNAIAEKFDYMALFYEIYGDYYLQTLSYQKAIDFYLKAIANQKKFHHSYAFIDSKITASYKALGDKKNMSIYMERAQNQHIIDREKDLKIVDKELDKIVSKKKTEKDNLENDHNLIILSIIIFCLLLLVVIFIRDQNLGKRKRKIILEQESRLLKKRAMIQEKEEEIEKLRQKVNESISELMELVKKNSPVFWTKFQDVYPDFTQKMLKRNPALKTTELCFLAYIYIGFRNKEIAEYTFKALKTIENNRSNLRKRISLSSDEDFTAWIRNYIAEA